MIAQYKPNKEDTAIIDDITNTIRGSLQEWYKEGASLDTNTHDIRSYRNSFILRYPITTTGGQKKMLLAKIRRNPKMDSLHQAVGSDIHQNIPTEYHSIKFVYNRLAHMQEDFGAIRPLVYIEKYHAIVMEEFPSRTLRQILVDHRRSKNGKGASEVRDAARKTGRWLHYFHNHVHISSEVPYTTGDILNEVQAYGEQLEKFSRGRVRAQSLVDAFARKLEKISLERVTFSQSHADMTCDNVLYSKDKRVCIIDIKTRYAPIYADLGLILIHPETSKQQIFSGGTYLPESLLKEYREEIVKGYFEESPGDERLVKIYSAIQVMDKWCMYEELMSRYKGVKHLLAFPIGPFVTAYFQNLLKKHLAFIDASEPGQALRMPKTADHSA